MTTKPNTTTTVAAAFAGVHLRCIETGARFAPDEIRYTSDSGGLLESVLDLDGIDADALRTTVAGRPPAEGVWRFRELLLPHVGDRAVTRQEGNTPLYASDRIAAFTGVDGVLLKHDGHNPTGSFKDRGMAVGMTVAKLVGARCVACASTGNTSASLASYAATAGLRSIVFIPAGAVALGKLSQTLAYGAKLVQLAGNFDDAMTLVRQCCDEFGIYLLNSINPYRIEGQKTVGFEIIESLGYEAPDWIVLPGGNLGNNSALFKGLAELKAVGLIDRLPRIAIIQAAGAAPLYHAFRDGHTDSIEFVEQPETVATAIRIGSPVSWRKSMAALAGTDGVVWAATDDQIMRAKGEIDAAGIGAEPAQLRLVVAGAKRLRETGVIKPSDRVVCILTGHLLKDPGAVMQIHAADGPENLPVVGATIDEVRRAVASFVAE